ncbi:hypothetical protein KKG45_08950 [bacterium]|nr:hypothetical protein [bacterium]
MLSLCFCAMAVSAVAGSDPAQRAGNLQGVTWSFSAWGRSAEGLACWLRDPDGPWRLDVLLTQEAERGQAAMNDLMHQLGDGWTIVATGDHGDFLQPWRDKIEVLSPGQRQRLTALLELAASGRDAMPGLIACGAEVQMRRPRHRHSRTPWPERTHEDDDVCAVTWPAAEAGGFRRRLEDRGRGRGAGDEVWRVSFAGERGWRLTSSRRAGSLRVVALPDRQVEYFPDEVFIPLWPLGELLSPGR